MNYNAVFETSNLKNAVIEIREKCRLPSEVLDNYSMEDNDTLIGKLIHVDKKNLKSYAFSISIREVQKLISTLPRIEDDKVVEKVLFIIKTRAKKNLFIHNWLLYQIHYYNKQVTSSMGIMMEYMKKNHSEAYKNTLPGLLEDLSENNINKVIDTLVEEGSNIKEFIEKYEIVEDSPFMTKIYTYFFKRCDRDGYMKNSSLFLKTFVGRSAYDVQEMVSDYIKCVDIMGFVDDINEDIISMYGKPYYESELWDIVDSELKAKFMKWISQTELKKHFGKESIQYKLWSEYTPKISDVIVQHQDSLLCIDFGSFVIVDINDGIDESYFYERDTFKREYKYYMDNRDVLEKPWELFRVGTTSARDVILKGIKPDIVKLNYSKVRVLYIREIIKKRLV